MPTLAVCAITRNAALTLPIALTSVRSVADQIIVVDSGSTDNTVAIAQSFGAKVIGHPWQQNYALQRNQYLGAVACDWVLVLDSDEFLDRQAVSWLQNLKSRAFTPSTDHYWVPRRWVPPFCLTHYLTNSSHYPDWQLRLFRANSDCRYTGAVHEQLGGFATAGERLSPFGLYHLNLYITDETARREKVRCYGALGTAQDGAEYLYLPKLADLELTPLHWGILDSTVQPLLLSLPVPGSLPAGATVAIAPVLTDVAHLQSQIQHYRDRLHWMEGSKFWQLRRLWQWARRSQGDGFSHE
ncbi:MAG: glycosyltransferase family 2 protein [Oscillatoriales cyanobacterium SM2_2_1]|nr:glycosyltransferase family 2 protein [Oscillatoriales cyanobacterium SM2_2_1]